MDWMMLSVVFDDDLDGSKLVPKLSLDQCSSTERMVLRINFRCKRIFYGNLKLQGTSKVQLVNMEPV